MAEGGRKMDDGRKRAMRFVIPHFSEAVLRPSDFLIFLTSDFLRLFHLLIAFVCRFMLAIAIVPSMIQPPMIVRNAGISPSNTNAKMIP